MFNKQRKCCENCYHLDLMFGYDVCVHNRQMSNDLNKNNYTCNKYLNRLNGCFIIFMFVASFIFIMQFLIGRYL